MSADEATRGVLRELAGAEAGRTRVAGALDEQQRQLTALLGRRERRLRERAEAEAQRAELTERLRDLIAQLRTLRRERSALAVSDPSQSKFATESPLSVFGQQRDHLSAASERMVVQP